MKFIDFIDWLFVVEEVKEFFLVDELLFTFVDTETSTICFEGSAFPFVLLFGREDNGLPIEVQEQCTIIASIPMPGITTETSKVGVRSLNLSVAVGIAAFYSCSKLGSIS